MKVTIKGVPDDISMADLATKLYRQFVIEAEVASIDQEQGDKPMHAQAAEILGHIHNRDYGLAESKAGLLRDQLHKGDWTLGGDEKAEKFDEECVGCCKVVDVAANLQKELDEYRETLRVERIDHTCERTAVNRKYHEVIRERDSLIESLRAGAKTNALKVEDLKKAIDDLKLTIKIRDGTIKYLSGVLDTRDDEWSKTTDARLIEDLRVELSARKEDSEVLMKVVEIVKNWDDSTGRAFPTLYKILDELVDYTDASEGSPDTDLDECPEITISFRGLSS